MAKKNKHLQRNMNQILWFLRYGFLSGKSFFLFFIRRPIFCLLNWIVFYLCPIQEQVTNYSNAKSFPFIKPFLGARHHAKDFSHIVLFSPQNISIFSLRKQVQKSQVISQSDTVNSKIRTWTQVRLTRLPPDYHPVLMNSYVFFPSIPPHRMRSTELPPRTLMRDRAFI